MPNLFQPIFDFNSSELDTPICSIPIDDCLQNHDSDKTTSYDIKVKDMRRAVLSWVLSQDPNGVGLLVPTRISRFQADVAGFWSSSRRRNGEKCLLPYKTVIIEVRRNREECWADCSKKDELSRLLKKLKTNKLSIENIIRKNEPHLRQDDNLFSEYEHWDYKNTKNQDYLKCLKEIDSVENSLYSGTKFERIKQANIADYLYLAVPEGEIFTYELAAGWGLLYIREDLSVEIKHKAQYCDCPYEKKLHLAQNIAAANLQSVMFRNGIKKDTEGNLQFTKIPKRRRK